MSQVIGWFFIALLALLGLLEWGRYRRAARLPGELPYPGPRFVRRLAVAALFAVSILLICYLPESNRPVQLACLLAVLLAMAGGLAMLWRDLHETSVQMVEHSRRASQEMGQGLQRWLERHQPPPESQRPPRDKAP